jgi:hypothetical protein
MNTYKLSNGTRMKKSEIDRRVRHAKATKLGSQQMDYGYNFCQECGKNTDQPVDCAHVISVDRCQKEGRTELAWDLGNIRILGRDCHRKHDKTTLG